MNTRHPATTATLTLLLTTALDARAQCPVRPLAQNFVTVYESPDPGGAYCYTPGLARLDDGRLVATMDLGGPGVLKMPGTKYINGRYGFQGKVFTSDEKTKLFWLLSSQSTDSMTRPDRLPKTRYNLPNNERHRQQLHFSKNCVDWCFAGLVARGHTPAQGRHYASMVIDGNDLHVLSRSGDHRAKDAHDGNLLTFHTIRDFRKLVY